MPIQTGDPPSRNAKVDLVIVQKPTRIDVEKTPTLYNNALLVMPNAKIARGQDITQLSAGLKQLQK